MISLQFFVDSKYFISIMSNYLKNATLSKIIKHTCRVDLYWTLITGGSLILADGRANVFNLQRKWESDKMIATHTSEM